MKNKKFILTDFDMTDWEHYYLVGYYSYEDENGLIAKTDTTKIEFSNLGSLLKYATSIRENGLLDLEESGNNE